MTVTAHSSSQRMREICGLAPILPVIVINDAAHAIPLAEALVAGGLPALEITLRTPAALDAIRAISQVPGAVVGAGTVVTAKDARAAKDAGATFAVSPGFTDVLEASCQAEKLPLLPGAATATETMRLMDRGYDMLKFFPAEASGGAAALRAMAAPLPQVGFCPTGGVNPNNAASYLAVGTVMCVGGSWLAPADLLDQHRWSDIETLAREGRALAQD